MPTKARTRARATSPNKMAAALKAAKGGGRKASAGMARKPAKGGRKPTPGMLGSGAAAKVAKILKRGGKKR